MIGGVLIEGLAYTLATVPLQRRPEAHRAAMQLLIERLLVADAD
jgi:hypothetical protein